MIASRTAVGTAERTGLVLVAASVCAAVMIGVGSAVSPTLAAAGLVALVAVPAAVLHPKLVGYLMVVTVFSQAVEVGGVTIGRLVAPLALIALVSQVLGHPVKLRGVRLILTVVGAYALVALASLAWTVSAPATLDALGALAISVVYMATFAALVRNRQDLTAMLWAIAASAVALASLWLAQYAQGIDRTENLAGDPNFTAAFLIMSLPIVVSLASSTGAPGRRALLHVAVAVIAAGAIATISRGGLATLGVTVVLMAVLPVRTLHSSPLGKAAFFLSIAIGLTVVLPVAGPQFAERFREAGTNANVVGGRGDLWQAAVTGYREHPVTGMGYGGFAATSFELLRRTPGVDLISHLRFVGEGEVVHNAYLETLTELGPAGAVLFLGVLAATGRTLLRTARRAGALRDPSLRSVANAFLVALLSFSASSVLLSTENSRALWMIIGLTVALPRLLAPVEGPSP